MFLTHHFAHNETLDRARYWLDQLGFRVERSHRPEGAGVPRLTVAGSVTEVEAAQMLIDTIEATDPEGWPGVRQLARMPHAAAVEPADEPTSAPTARPSAVGWHPTFDDDLLADAEIRSFHEWYGR